MNNARAFQIAFQLGAKMDSSFRRAFNSANESLSDMESGTESLSKSNKALQSVMNMTGKAVLATGVTFASIGAGLGAAAVSANDYMDSMKQVQAATGASVQEMKEIKEISKNLYNKNLGEDWNEVAQAISEVKSVTDLSGGSLETATKYAMQYKDVWGEEVSQSIKASDTMMKNFGITAEQSYNLLAQGAQRGLNKSDELIDSANEYAVYFKTLNYSANEMFDIFNAGLENGAFNLDKVGDIVKEFGIRIKDGSKATSDALSYLFQADGFEDYMKKLQNGGTSTKQFMELASQVGRENAAQLLKDLKSTGAASEKAYKSIEWTMGGAGQFLDALSSGALDGKDAMQQVIQKISEIGDTSLQSQMAVALFGTQAEDLEMKTLLALGNVQDSFDMTKKTMEEVGKIKYDTVGNALKGIGRQFETQFVIPLGEKVLPHLNTFSNYLSGDVSGTIKSFKDVLSTIAPIALGVVTAFVVYKGTLAGVAAAQLTFNAVQKISIALYRAHRAAMIAYSLYGGGVKGIIHGMRAAMVALNGTMMANPFVLVIAVLAGLAVAFYAAYKMSDTFREKVDKAFATVRDKSAEAIAYIKVIAPQLWQGFIDHTQNAFAKMRQTYDDFISFVGSKYQAVSQWVNGLQGPAQSVVGYIKSSFAGIGNTIATLSPLIARLGLSFLGVTGPVGWVIASVISIGAFLYKLVKTNDDVRSSMINAWESIKSAFAPVMELFAESGKTLLSMLVPAITEIATSFATLGPEFQKTGQIMKDSFVTLGPAFAELGPVFSELFVTLGSLFSGLATSLIPMVVDGFVQLMPIISQLFSTWISFSSIIVTTILPMLLQGVQMVFPMILGIIQTVLPFVIKLLGTLIPVVLQIAVQLLPLLLKGAQMIFPMVLGIVQAVLPVVIQLIGALIPIILTIAQTVIPLILQAVQLVFPIVLSIIQAVIPIITFLLKGVAIILTNIVVPAIQVLLKIVQFVFPLIMLAIKSALNFVTGIIRTFTSLLQGDWKGAWENIKKTAQNIMNNIIEFFKAINLYDTGKAILKGLIDGIKSMANVTMGAIGGIVNGIIKGINWVLDKVGVEISLNEWKVPKYANGTKGHPGGPAILGDGGGPELYRTPSGFVGLSPGTDTLMNLPKGTEVIPHRQTQQILNNYNIPAYKEGTGISNALKTGWNWIKEKGSAIKEKALDVWSYVSDPSKLMDKVLEKFGIGIPSIKGIFGDVTKGSFDMVKEKAVNFVKEKLAGFGSWNGKGAAAPGDVTKWLTAAINITGVPMSWLGPLQTMAMKESGGNPRAINLWDSNAKKGIPSKGLMQTIDPTFNAYKMPGMDDIWNPIHNAVASIRYTMSRYGSIFNTPGMRSMASGGGYKGYYQGGTTPNSDYYWAGERGPELLKLPGATQINSNQNSKSMLGSLLESFFSFGGKSPGKIGADEGEIKVDFTFAPVIHVNGNGGSVYDEVMEALKTAGPEMEALLIKLLAKIKNDEDRTRLA